MSVAGKIDHRFAVLCSGCEKTALGFFIATKRVQNLALGRAKKSILF